MCLPLGLAFFMLKYILFEMRKASPSPYQILNILAFVLLLNCRFLMT